MGLFDLLKRMAKAEPEKTAEAAIYGEDIPYDGDPSDDEDIPYDGDPSDGEDIPYDSPCECEYDSDDPDDSISQSVSKVTEYEEFSDPGFDIPGIAPPPDSITSEVIRKNEPIMGTYTVISDAITGGMGSVWKVHHDGWNTDLAMKRPKPKFFAEAGRARKENFIHECKAWIDLGLHPNIVSCYYVREIGGVPSIFSEWMENGDLERHIKDGTLYEGTAEALQERLLDIAIQFARGLHYAHENDLIHQDVKPANLLLTAEWEAKVSDFGIARARSLLADGKIVNGPTSDAAPGTEFDPEASIISPYGGKTPAYCSPEQAAEQPLTRRTDIYSWAVSVMEMYLGAKPWTRKGGNGNKAPDGTRLTGPDAGAECREYFDMCTERPIPAALQELLALCMRKEPDERPKDFGVIEAALEKIYRETAGRDYPRPAPKAASDTADSLNNKALSYLDLGQTEVSRECWKEALAKDPKHMLSLYNYALFQWRGAEIDDLEALHMLQLHEKEEDFERLSARLELERGNPEAVGGKADEEEREASKQQPALEQQVFPLDKIEIDENVFLEVSPDGDRVLCGDNGAMLFSASRGEPVWTNTNMKLHQGSSVRWEDGEICGRSGDWLEFYGLSDGVYRRLTDMKNDHEYPVFSHYRGAGELYAARALKEAYHMILMDPEHVHRPCLRDKIIKDLPFVMEKEHIEVLFMKNGDFVLLYWKQREDTEVIRFDGENWEMISRFTIDGKIENAFPAADENGIWCYSSYAGCCLYDLQTGEKLLKAPGFDSLPQFCVSGDLIISSGQNTSGENFIRFLNPRTGRCLRTVLSTGRCFDKALKATDGRVALVRSGSHNSARNLELVTMRRPVFRYFAKWELARIRTAAVQIDLEDRFLDIMALARKAMDDGELEKALSLVGQAMDLDESVRSDPRAGTLLHEIRARGTKVRLRGATLMRTLRADTKELSFTDDGKQLYIAEDLVLSKNKNVFVMDLDSGTIRSLAGQERLYTPTWIRRDRKERMSREILPVESGFYRIGCEVSGDGRLAAAVDAVSELTITGNSSPKCVLRAGAAEEPDAARSVELSGFNANQIIAERLHFTLDGRTLLLTRQMTEASVKPIVVNFSFWNAAEAVSLGPGAAELEQVRAFEVEIGPELLHTSKSYPPDEIYMFIEHIHFSADDHYALIEIRSAAKDHNEFKYIMVDLTTGEKTAALPHTPMRLTEPLYRLALRSNKLQFTGEGKQIIYIKDPSTVAITPLREGDEEVEIRGDFKIPEDVLISPDGLFLAIGGGEHREEVFVYSLDWEMRY